MTTGDPVPSELVAGKYRVTRLLGRGGMGSVWAGVHVSLGTQVAIKFIEAEYADNEEARARFENEARAAATLQSKHVVQVHDHGVMPDGRPYIVMEFLAGEPLDKRLEREGVLPLETAVRLVRQICRALTRAHEAGIIHRDLKPENIFLVRDEEDGTDIAKVVDFGIAKFTGGSVGLSSSTKTGAVLGTPYYMSPEQARGLRNVDARSDLWSVAVIAYRAVVGVLPFEGEAVGDLLVKICTAPLPVPSRVRPDLPPGFDAWFQRALARDPAQRYQSAAELADALALAVGLPGGAAAGHLGSTSAVPLPTPGTPYPAALPAYGTPMHGAAQASAATANPARPAALLEVTTGDSALTHSVGYPPRRSGPPVGMLVAGGGVALVGVTLAAWVGVRSMTGGPAVGVSAPPDTPALASGAAGAAPPEPASPATDAPAGTSDTLKPPALPSVQPVGSAGPRVVTPRARPAPAVTTTARPVPTRRGGDVDVGY